MINNTIFYYLIYIHLYYRCLVLFTGLNEKFRNDAENTNSFKFKKHFFIKSVKNQTETENLFYWIINTRKYQNLGNNFESQIKKDLDEIFNKF